MTAKKIFKKLHLWLSIPFGIIITLICFSGAMLVFEKEIVRGLNPSLFKVDVPSEQKEPLSLDYLTQHVQSSLDDGVEITGVTVFDKDNEAFQFNLSKPRRASVYVNQYTGEILGRYQRTAFFSTMFALHRWLLDRPGQGSASVGKIVVGVSTLVFVAILLTGLVIWWPRSKKALHNSLKISVNGGWRRFWYGLHVAGGVYAMLFLLAMALTGPTWSFGWYRDAFYKTFGVEVASGQGAGHSSSQGTGHGVGQSARNGQGHGTGQGAGSGEGQSEIQGGGHGQGSSHGQKSDIATNNTASWQTALNYLKQENPGYKQITITNGSASVKMSNLGNSRATDKWSFDTSSGQLLDCESISEQPKTSKIRGWIYSVHVGSFGGLTTRILWFVTALMGAALPVTGYYLWIRRLVKNKKRQQS